MMSPPEFMQRLAALVPRPRLHLIRFGVRMTSLREVSGPPLREHGVLAPNAKLRAQVIPAEARDDADARLHSEAVQPDPDDGHRWGLASVGRCFSSACSRSTQQHCPNCGGELKIIAAILDTTVIERILEHPGLPARPPPRSPARAPMPQAA
jgi:hypothetical protein